MQKSEILKMQAENEQLRAELMKATIKLDCALESNAALSAQMTDLQEKLDIIINQFNKQKKKQHSSKNEHHNPRQAPGNANEPDGAQNNKPSNSGGAASLVKKSSRLK
jgi:hypothetical protein